MQHARRMARYNAPLYSIIAVTIAGGALLAFSPSPGWLRAIGAAVTVGAAWYGLASFAAFYWLFDRSPLLGGRWVTEIVPTPARWVQLSVFLEETTLPMREVFPHAEGIELDLFHPDVMTEAAVNRARSPDDRPRPRPSSPGDLDVETAWADLVLVVLVAHELRDPGLRTELFRELARVTANGGRILLVEHTQNLAALLAYGPGWWHFLPEREWRERSSEADLEVVETQFFTPFVQVFVLEHSGREEPGAS